MQQTDNKLWTLAFIFITVSNALVITIFEMLLPTLPLFITKLGGGASQIGIVTGIFTLSAILIRPFAGLLATKFNKKYLLIGGIIVNALSTGAYYLSSSIEMILFIRFIHGAGFGLVTTYFATIAAEFIPRHRRGEGMGYFGLGEMIAVSIGPMIGILTLELYDFQRLFLGGMAILILATLMAFVFKRTPENIALDKETSIKITFVEKRVLFPAFLMVLVGIAAGSIMSFLSLYGLEKNFDQVGLFFFIMAAASFAIRLISGRLFDLYGVPIILIPGAILSIMGFIILYVAESTLMFSIAAILYGFGFGALFPAIQTWCMNLVEEHEHEGAMAMFLNAFDLGIGGGSLLLGIIAAVTSYQMIYMVAAIAYFFVLVAYMIYFVKIKRRINIAVV